MEPDPDFHPIRGPKKADEEEAERDPGVVYVLRDRPPVRKRRTVKPNFFDSFNSPDLIQKNLSSSYQRSYKPLKESLFLHLSSDDSKDIHTSNSNVDFTSELPFDYDLSHRNFELGLITCNIVSVDGKVLYLFCDAIEGQVVYCHELPVLRRLNTNSGYFNTIFCSVNKDHLSKIRLYIRDENYEVPTLTAGTLRCTLELKPK